MAGALSAAWRRPRYARRMRQVNAALLPVYLSGATTRRIRWALKPLLAGAPVSLITAAANSGERTNCPFVCLNLNTSPPTEATTSTDGMRFVGSLFVGGELGPTFRGPRHFRHRRRRHHNVRVLRVLPHHPRPSGVRIRRKRL